MRDEPSDVGDVLIDVTELSLGDLEAIDESTLAQALRHVLDEQQRLVPVGVAPLCQKRSNARWRSCSLIPAP